MLRPSKKNTLPGNPDPAAAGQGGHEAGQELGGPVLRPKNRHRALGRELSQHQGRASGQRGEAGAGPLAAAEATHKALGAEPGTRVLSRPPAARGEVLPPGLGRNEANYTLTDTLTVTSSLQKPELVGPCWLCLSACAVLRLPQRPAHVPGSCKDTCFTGEDRGVCSTKAFAKVTWPEWGQGLGPRGEQSCPGAPRTL